MNIQRIKADITTARNNLSFKGNPTNDEYLYDIAAYHTQQAVEKILKYLLHNKYGMDDTVKQFKTHNISTLLIMINSYDSNFINNHQKLVDLSDEITNWEASTRYSEDLVATKNIIIEVLDYCEFVLLKEIQINKKDNNIELPMQINIEPDYYPDLYSIEILSKSQLEQEIDNQNNTQINIKNCDDIKL